MNEGWLLPGAMVPVDMETTATLVAEIKRLIDVVGGLVLKQGPDYERGFVDGMQKQAQSSVDKAVNAMAQPEQESKMVASMLVEDGRISFAAKILADGTYDLYTAPLKQEHKNFCPRCGKRTNDIHTCTPPRGLEMT